MQAAAGTDEHSERVVDGTKWTRRIYEVQILRRWELPNGSVPAEGNKSHSTPVIQIHSKHLQDASATDVQEVPGARPSTPADRRFC